MGTVLSCQLDGRGCLIVAAVVHDEDFIGSSLLIQIGDDARQKKRQASSLVIGRNDD